MKKILSILCVMILCLGLLAGCGSDATGSEKAAITPLPAAVDISNITDCTLAVSFAQGDVFLDDTGALQMKAKVYAYDTYDIVDISELAEGDIIIMHGEEVEVTSVEKTEGGLVMINGGMENGGFDLFSADSNVYYESGYNDVKTYNELGEVTLRVSTEFIYTDASNIDADPVIYYPGDFLTDIAGIDYNFNPNNTSIVVEDGTVIAMNRIYMP